MEKIRRGKLDTGIAPVRWRFEPAGRVDDAARSFLLGQLLSTPAAAIMGSRLIDLQTAIFRAPPMQRLLGDPDLLATAVAPRPTNTSASRSFAMIRSGVSLRCPTRSSFETALKGSLQNRTSSDKADRSSTMLEDDNLRPRLNTITLRDSHPVR